MKSASEMRTLTNHTLSTREASVINRVREYCEGEIANRIECSAKNGRNNVWVGLKDLRRIPYVTESTIATTVKEHLASAGYIVSPIEGAGFRIMW